MTRAAWVVAGAIVAFHLATATVYGYHRDEFYYLASGRRLAWGYVDHPPLTPLLYRVSDGLFGSTPFGLRVIPALLHGLIVALVALLAREFGGGDRALFIAALGAAVAPLFLTTGHFLGTVTVEAVIWAAALLVFVRLLNGGDGRLWLVFGAVVGLGLLDKWTTLYLVVALAVGLLVAGDRSVLATPWVFGGGAITLALWAPNLWWQARHDWPQLEFAGTLRDYGEALFTAPYQLVLLGVASVLLAIPGLLWLARNDGAQPYRSLAVAYLVVIALVTASGGKPYYAAVFAPALIAAGAVATERPGWTLPALLVGIGVVMAPFATPLLPLGTAETVRKVNPEIGEMVGWPELVDTVAAVYAQHPGATILTSNYSEAGSIELLGRARGLPQPMSGHNTYAYWGHAAGRSEVTITVGLPRSFVESMFGDVRLAATFRAPAGVHNLEDGAPIFVARDQIADWDELWPRIRHV